MPIHIIIYVQPYCIFLSDSPGVPVSAFTQTVAPRGVHPENPPLQSVFPQMTHHGAMGTRVSSTTRSVRAFILDYYNHSRQKIGYL